MCHQIQQINLRQLANCKTHSIHYTVLNIIIGEGEGDQRVSYKISYRIMSKLLCLTSVWCVQSVLVLTVQYAMQLYANPDFSLSLFSSIYLSPSLFRGA